MPNALLSTRDETPQGATFCDQHALTHLFESLGRRITSSNHPRRTGAVTSVRVHDPGMVIADGPFAETKEQILGMVVVACQARARIEHDEVD